MLPVSQCHHQILKAFTLMMLRLPPSRLRAQYPLRQVGSAAGLLLICNRMSDTCFTTPAPPHSFVKTRPCFQIGRLLNPLFSLMSARLRPTLVQGGCSPPSTQHLSAGCPSRRTLERSEPAVEPRLPKLFAGKDLACGKASSKRLLVSSQKLKKSTALGRTRGKKWHIDASTHLSPPIPSSHTLYVYSLQPRTPTLYELHGDINRLRFPSITSSPLYLSSLFLFQMAFSSVSVRRPGVVR